MKPVLGNSSFWCPMSHVMWVSRSNWETMTRSTNDCHTIIVISNTAFLQYMTGQLWWRLYPDTWYPCPSGRARKAAELRGLLGAIWQRSRRGYWHRCQRPLTADKSGFLTAGLPDTSVSKKAQDDEATDCKSVRYVASVINLMLYSVYWFPIGIVYHYTAVRLSDASLEDWARVAIILFLRWVINLLNRDV